MKSVTLSLIFLITCLLALNSPAQTVKLNETSQKTQVDQLQKQRQDNPKMVIVRQLMAQRNYLGASALLENMYEVDPNNSQIQNLLFRCYRELKFYGKSEDLTRRQLEKYPNNLHYNLSLAEFLVLQGENEEGIKYYDKTISLIPDNDENRTLLIIRSLMAHELADKALSLINETRTIKKEATLFGFERGSILEKMKEYEEAANEFILIMVDDSSRYSNSAEKKLLTMLGFEETREIVEEMLAENLHAQVSPKALKILTTHHLKQKSFENAFEYALAFDSLTDDSGKSLYQFLRQCRNHKAYEQVVQAGDLYLQLYPQTPMKAMVLFDVADAKKEIGLADEAITDYRTLLSIIPDNENAATARYSIGRVYFDLLNDYDKAILEFQAVTNMPNKGVAYLNSMRSIPHCYLKLGDLNSAEIHFENLNELNLPDEMLEEKDYYLALIDFYNKKYDSSETAFRKLMLDYPRGYFINDALKLIMILTDAKADPDGLYDYSSAHFFRERYMYDSASTRLENLTENTMPTLADIALYELTQIDMMDEDTTSALNRLEILFEKYPDSYYVPYGLKMKADILLLDSKKKDESAEIYRKLLEEYQNYPFANDVRMKLKEITANDPA